MKRVLLLNGDSTIGENYAIRSALETFGFVVTMYNIGRPNDYYNIFSDEVKFDYDYLIIGCHGDGGKIIVPVLGHDIYFEDECPNNIGFDEINGKINIKSKVVISTGCTTGSGNLPKAFIKNNNTFLAPADFIDGKSDLLFVINFFYHLSNNCSLKDSYQLASRIDSETRMYKLYMKEKYYV